MDNSNSNRRGILKHLLQSTYYHGNHMKEINDKNKQKVDKEENNSDI